MPPKGLTFEYADSVPYPEYGGRFELLPMHQAHSRSRTSARLPLADDHQGRCVGAGWVIRATGMRVVGEASDGKAAFDRIRQLQPLEPSVDIVVMDVSMPQWNGAETTVQVKRALPATKLLALSMHEDGLSAKPAHEKRAHRATSSAQCSRRVSLIPGDSRRFHRDDLDPA